MRNKKKSEKKEYDWESIKAQYRLGTKSLRVLSAEFGPSHGAIGKKAQKENWPVDKSEEVRELTRAALIKETGTGDAKGDSRNSVSPIELKVAVATNVSVVLGHRKHIKKSWALAKKLEVQLEENIDSGDELSKSIFSAVSDPKEQARLVKAISLPQNVSVLRDLTTIMKNTISLERQAFGLDEGGGGDNGKSHELKITRTIIRADGKDAL